MVWFLRTMAGVYGVGETLTFAAQRLLTNTHSLAREFGRHDISKLAPINGAPPETDEYQRLFAGRFVDWRLTVDGLVTRPSSFSLADLKGLPSRTQITHQACEEGWSFIAEWTGVPLSHVLDRVGVSTRAKYVVFYPFGGTRSRATASTCRTPGTRRRCSPTASMARSCRPGTGHPFG